MHLLSLFSFAVLSSASPLTTRHALHQVPPGWSLIASAPSDHLIDMRIGLKQSRIDELLTTLAEVSDPAHKRYGMHLSKLQVEKLISPHKDTIKSVEDWLYTFGVNITGRSSAGDWIHAKVPVERAERMLNTRYNVYHHHSGTHLVRSESYSLPCSLDDHIDLIQPTTFFGKIHEGFGGTIQKRASTTFAVDKNTSSSLDCSLNITPDCLKKLYRTEGYVPSEDCPNSIGITGYLEEWPSRLDLRTFYKKYHPAAINSSFTVELVNGGLDPLIPAPGMEANLDVQYAGTVTHPMKNIYYSIGGRPTEFLPDTNTPTNDNEPYIDWLNYMLAKDTLSLTITTSYADDEQTVPFDYAKRVCQALAALTARGVSLLYSSGDSGVGGGKCLTNNLESKKQFLPTFPASCPYVTSVGATYDVSPEIGAGFSQGGFSNYFKRPAYQASAVDGFLKDLGKTYDGLYNKTGRAFPDVSAQGRNYQVIIANGTFSIFGTSASCPTFAGVVALLNDYRLSQGKPSLGFLNPWLYGNPSMLNDITTGNNPGCGTPGFNATAGWDPVTGLGTPDFIKMKEAALCFSEGV